MKSPKVVRLDEPTMSVSIQSPTADESNQSGKSGMKSTGAPMKSQQLEVPVHTTGVRASLARMRQSRREAQDATGEKV